MLMSLELRRPFSRQQRQRGRLITPKECQLIFRVINSRRRFLSDEEMREEKSQNGRGWLLRTREGEHCRHSEALKAQSHAKLVYHVDVIILRVSFV